MTKFFNNFTHQRAHTVYIGNVMSLYSHARARAHARMHAAFNNIGPRAIL